MRYPVNWEIVKLSDICDIKIGKTPARKTPGFWKDGIYPWLSISDMNQGRMISNTKEKITEYAAKKTKINLVPQNTLLLSFKLSIGKVGITAIPMFTNEAIAALTNISKKATTEYLYWVLKSINLEEGIDRAAKGKTLNKKKLAEIEIPLPPLPEQKRIATILDKADALRDKRKKSIAKLDDLLQSVFFDMFGDPVTNPKGWDFDSLAKSTKKISDGTHHSPPIVDSGIPYITAKHLRKEGLRFYDDPWYISVDDHLKIYSRCDPTKGDVLYIKDGATTGLAAINRYDFQFSMLSSLALLRPKETLLTPEYLCYWLNNDRVKVSITEQMGGAAIRRLTLTKIKKLRLPIPPLFLQKQFSDIVNEVNKIKEVHIESLKNLETIFFSIQQRAFSGEL